MESGALGRWSSPPEAVRDRERLTALREADLLDTPPEEAFDQMTCLASRLLHTPVSLVSLVDEDRQFFKSCIGLPEPWASARETPLSHSFCQYVVAHEKPLVVEDAREHPVLKDNLAIRDLGVIAYLGVPVVTTEGKAIGTLCVIDSRPRRWTAEDLETLQSLAASVMSTIQLRAAARAAAREMQRGGTATAIKDAVSAARSSGALQEACEASEVLWNATCAFLQGLDEYDRLIRNYQPTAESLAEESRLRDRIRDARENLQRALEEFLGCAARLNEGEEDRMLRRAQALAEAICDYLEAEKRRAEASMQFQQLHGPLDELEGAVALAARAEGRVREAAEAFELTR